MEPILNNKFIGAVAEDYLTASDNNHRLAPESNGISEVVRRHTPFSQMPENEKGRIPADVEDAYPLSTLQAGIIFQSELVQNATWYHDILSYSFSGLFDKDAFTSAMAQLWREHPALRTSYRLKEYGEFIQLVHKEPALPLYISDWREHSSTVQNDLFENFFLAESAYRFKWDEAQLVRIHVQILSSNRFRYNLSFHNSALDAWSAALIHTKLFRLYSAHKSGTPAGESKTDRLLAQYIQLERETIASSDAAEYWQMTLDRFGAESAHFMGGELTKTPDVQSLDIAIDKKQSDDLRAMAQALGVPLKNLLLTVHLRVMGFITSNDKVLTGYEISGRPESTSTGQAIGLFLNTLPFGMELKAGESWKDLIRRSYNTEVEFLPYRRFPMAKMKALARREGRLFDTVFNFTHFTVLKELHTSSGLENFDVRAQVETEFPLRVEFSQDYLSDDVQLNFKFHANLIDDAEINRIAGYFVTAMAMLVASPDAFYINQPLLGSAEHQELAAVGYGPRSFIKDGLTVLDLFHSQLPANATRIAFQDEEGTVNYSDFFKHADTVSNIIRQATDVLGPVVAVSLERSNAWAATMTGILQAGAVYLPLDANFPDERLHSMLKDAGVNLLLCADQDFSRFQAIIQKNHLSCVAHLVKSGSSNDAISLPHVDPKHLAYILFTSGSTGKPKGAMIEHGGMLNHLFAKINDLDIGENDVIAQTAPQTFDVSIWQTIIGLAVAAKTVIYSRTEQLDVSSFVKKIAADGITVIEMVPSYFANLLDYLEVHFHPLPIIKTVLLTGEALKGELAARWLTLYPNVRLVNAYGPTEASDDVTHHDVKITNHSTVPLGKPLQNLRIHLLNKHDTLVPRGSIGEICVSGIGVGRGYINSPEKTKSAFEFDHPLAGWSNGRLYRTGDFGRWLPDGNLEFLGRKDDQIKIRGMRIELGEIENVMMTAEGVRNAAVIACKDPVRETRLIGFVEGDVDADKVLLFLAERLPAHMVPDHITLMEALPLNDSGKVSKIVLGAMAPTAVTKRQANDAPCTPTEKRVAEIWANALNIDISEIGRTSGFFELGGDSLSAMVAVMRSNDLFSIIDVYKNRTVLKLAEHIDTGAAAEEGLLKCLSAKQSGETAIVCFTYAGGNAINFQPLADVLNEYDSKVCVYGIEPPGHGNNAIGQLVDVPALAELCCKEAVDKGIKEVIVWGHCAGSSAAIAFSAAAAQKGIRIKALVLGAKLLTSPEILSRQIQETEAMSDLDVANWLMNNTEVKLSTGKDDLLIRHLGKVYRHDVVESNRYLLGLWKERDLCISCPVINLLAEDDPVTASQEEHSSNWLRVGKDLKTEMLKSGGHFFMKTVPQDVSTILSRFFL